LSCTVVRKTTRICSGTCEQMESRGSEEGGVSASTCMIEVRCRLPNC